MNRYIPLNPDKIDIYVIIHGSRELGKHIWRILWARSMHRHYPKPEGYWKDVADSV